MTTTYDAVLQREKCLSPEECLALRKNGKIDPAKILYASHDPETGASGGFWLKLDSPRYNTTLQPAATGYLQ